jgi:hypothetical protein
MINLAGATRRLSGWPGPSFRPIALKTPFPSSKINYSAMHKKRNGVGALHYENAGDLTLSQGRSRNVIDRVVWVTIGRGSGVLFL